MANDGQIVFEVSLDGKTATADLKDITNAIKKESKQWDDQGQKSADNISGSFASMAKKIVATISAAKIGQMLLNIGKDAIEAASNLEEVQNVVDTTFGDAGSIKIEKWAKNAGKQFGLTETQAKQFTSTLGAMMKSAGLTGDEIVNMSTDMAGLAADMASFYNLDFDTAFQKIRAGLSGETEPLKQLGINLSVANLNAYAMAEGLEKTYDQMDQGEQTMLRYQYIMKATADAQGDFAKTSDGFANASRKMETEIETLKTKLGSVLIPVAASIVGEINKILESLTSGGKRTVLDDFADIDLKTEQKIKEIESTKAEANVLVDVLDSIGQKSADNKDKVSEMADAKPKTENLNDLVSKLDGISKQAETDQTNIGSIADTAPNDKNLDSLVEKLNNVGSIAITGESEIKKLGSDEIDTSNIETVTEKVGEIGTTAETSASSISGVLDQVPDAERNHGIASIQNKLEAIGAIAQSDNTDIQKITDGAPDGTDLNGVKESLDDVETAAGTAAEAISGVSNPTAETAENSALWLATCKELVDTIPGLSSIINTQTGEIIGGTEAVRNYIDAWEAGQKYLAYQSSHEQKRAALDSYSSELPTYELDATVAKYRLRKQYEQLKEYAKQYSGVTLGVDQSGNIKFDYSGAYGLQQSDIDLMDEAAKKATELQNAYNGAYAAWMEQKNAYDEAVAAWEEEGQIIQETYQQAIESSGEWSESQKEAAFIVVSSFGEALQAVEDYYNAVRESAAADVNKTLSGFNYVKSGDETLFENNKEAAEQYAKTYEDLQALLGTEIHIKIDTANANKQIEDMLAGMKSQIAFIEQYQKDLQTAREKGLSDDIASMLADGSEASAAYLAAIAEADADQIAEINATWDTLTEKKEAFTDTLTEQRLAADEEYDALVEKAKQAAQDLDLSVEMGDNAGKSIQAIADAIKEHIPDIAEQVDAVLAQLARLNDANAKVQAAKSSNNTGVTKPSQNKSYLSYDVGTDYVPYTGLFNLHEGEAVLTREENRLWQSFKNNQNSIDYDTLGGVMRDNVHAGGNVYLNGREVGKVISQEQGNQYRSLQRSGWQQ